MTTPRLHFMLHAPVPMLLARLSLPNIAIVITQTASVVADAWFVGRVGTPALASLAVVYPVQALMQMMSAGAMGGGISSAVARAMGGGATERAAALLVHALVIALVMAGVYTLLAGVFARDLFALLGADGPVLDGAVRYAQIAFGGCVVLWITNTLASVLRGSGNMLLPGVVLVVTQLGHVVLCGVLTLGLGPFPAMGVAGPAIALVTSFSLAGLVLGVLVASGRAGLPRMRVTLRLRRDLFHDILKVGAVACLNALLTVATVFIITRLVAAEGTAALAGYGLGSRLELVLVPLTFGIGAALTASVGANFGAGQFARARRIAISGGALVAVVTGTIGVTVGLAPDLWLAHFSADPAVLEAGATYLRIVAPVYGFFTLGMALYFASQGTGNMSWPLAAGALRLLLAAGGAAAATAWLGLGLTAIFTFVAAGLILFGVIIAASLAARPWNPERTLKSET